MPTPVVEVKGLTREYQLGAERVIALRGVNLSVFEGEMVAIMGASGSGKSTLMNVLGCLDRPSAGEYLLGGVAVGALDDDALADIRGERLGFVFQGFNLLPRTTAVENVALPMLYDRQGRFANPTARAVAALQRVGLGDRLNHQPNELSGGQQQRVAIARTLMMRPEAILFDEPTSALDPVMANEVLGVISDLARADQTMIVVTHSMRFARQVSDHVHVFAGGHDVEFGPPDKVFGDPQHETTKSFLKEAGKD